MKQNFILILPFFPFNRGRSEDVGQLLLDQISFDRMLSRKNGTLQKRKHCNCNWIIEVITVLAAFCFTKIIYLVNKTFVESELILFAFRNIFILCILFQIKESQNARVLPQDSRCSQTFWRRPWEEGKTLTGGAVAGPWRAGCAEGPRTGPSRRPSKAGQCASRSTCRCEGAWSAATSNPNTKKRDKKYCLGKTKQH